MHQNELKNILNDDTLPQEAKNFINKLITKDNFQTGRFDITKDIYANIEKYNTKPVEQGLFETHDKYTDIQFLLSGKEKIYYRDRKSLPVNNNYDKQRDITFYKDNITSSEYVILDGTNYVVFTPEVAHAPQIALNEPDGVLKVVVKIRQISERVS